MHEVNKFRRAASMGMSVTDRKANKTAVKLKELKVVRGAKLTRRKAFAFCPNQLYTWNSPSTCREYSIQGHTRPLHVVRNCVWVGG